MTHISQGKSTGFSRWHVSTLFKEFLSCLGYIALWGELLGCYINKTPPTRMNNNMFFNYIYLLKIFYHVIQTAPKNLNKDLISDNDVYKCASSYLTKMLDHLFALEIVDSLLAGCWQKHLHKKINITSVPICLDIATSRRMQFTISICTALSLSLSHLHYSQT